MKLYLVFINCAYRESENVYYSWLTEASNVEEACKKVFDKIKNSTCLKLTPDLLYAIPMQII